jgi:hypothetical protein
MARRLQGHTLTMEEAIAAMRREVDTPSAVTEVRSLLSSHSTRVPTSTPAQPYATIRNFCVAVGGARGFPAALDDAVSFFVGGTVCMRRCRRRCRRPAGGD